MIQVNSRQDAADSAGTFPDPKSFEDTSHRLIQQNLIDTGEHRPHAHVERGWEWKSARHVDPVSRRRIALSSVYNRDGID